MLLPRPISLLCALACIATAQAQTADATECRVPDAGATTDTRLVTKSTMYGIGHTQLQDTYLSPEEYSGVELRLSRESMRMTRIMHGRVSLQSYFQANLGYTGNRADNNKTVTALANWNYALHRHFPVTDNISLLAGPLADISGGFTYNMRNGNNPASLRASAAVGASVAALWSPKVGKRVLGLRWQVNAPLLGVAFMPHYGQSYYEIFSLGDGSGTVRLTTPFSSPSMRQMISADCPVGGLRLRVAYVGDVQQLHLNGIKTHVYSHVFMIGIVKQFIRL